MQRLGIVRGTDRRALHRTLDHPDVKADLLLQCADLMLRRPPHVLDRVTGHRVVYAPDETWDAHDPLQVYLDHVERRRAGSMLLGELEGQLVREGGLAGVARPEDRD